MSRFEKTLGLALVLGLVSGLGCSGKSQLVGSNDNGVNSGANGGAPSQSTRYQLLLLDADEQGQPSKCLPEALPLDASGKPSAKVFTSRRGAACDCAESGLATTGPEISRALRFEALDAGFCRAPGSALNGTATVACEDLCACEILQATGDDLAQCQSEPDASGAGWCYVSETGGAAERALLADCPDRHPQQRIRFLGDAVATAKSLQEALFLGVFDPSPTPAALGEVCLAEEEYSASFRGFDVKEVAVHDHASMCTTGICLQNHFQGRASCPYGQTAGNGDCLVAGGYDSVTGSVKPQLLARQASAASICSCQCAGSGPGPYCTCPEQMQCEHLVDDLGLGQANLAGSYCIPKGTQYDRNGDTSVCETPDCGEAHRFF